MKNILLFLSFFLLSLLGVKGIGGNLPSEEGAGVESVLQAEASAGYILPSTMEAPDGSEAYASLENLARQYRIAGRGQRSFSGQRMFVGKGSAYRAAKRGLEILFHTINYSYTSLPCLSWAVSSDHYIFGLRRILI